MIFFKLSDLIAHVSQKKPMSGGLSYLTSSTSAQGASLENSGELPRDYHRFLDSYMLFF